MQEVFHQSGLADAQMLRSMYLSSFRGTSLEHEWSLDAVRTHLLDPKGEALHSQSAFSLYRVDRGECSILALGVLPVNRHRGLGSQILARVLCTAVARRADIVTLLVEPSNLAARNLYDRAGFVELGERLSYYSVGGPALFLGRCLSPDAGDGQLMEKATSNRYRPGHVLRSEVRPD